jgi:hypothetical protein
MTANWRYTMELIPVYNEDDCEVKIYNENDCILQISYTIKITANDIQ